MNRTINLPMVNRMAVQNIQDKQDIKEFVMEIMENGKNIVFQLHSDGPNVLRTIPLDGMRPHIHTILDAMAGTIKRNLKGVYDSFGNFYRVTIADYVK